MANLLDKFKSTSVGSSGRIMDYTSKLYSTGDFTKIYNLDVLITSWYKILSTPKGSMDHDPEFGSNLYLYIFEPADTETQEGIKNEIVTALSTYDDRANVTDIEVTFYKNKKGFNVKLVVDYDGDKSEMSLTIDENEFQNYL